jgi:hypothetical protein
VDTDSIAQRDVPLQRYSFSITIFVFQTASTTGGTMAFTRAKVVAKIGASADRVWNEIAPFNNLPAIMGDVVTKSTLDRKGIVRALKVKGVRGTLYERLLKYDSATRVTSYDIIDDPNDMCPFTNYTSTIRVKPVTARSCTVEWSSRFEPKKGRTKAEGIEFAEGVYNAGISGTKKVLGLGKRPAKKKAKPAKKKAK